jgi:hypothetical protein
MSLIKRSCSQGIVIAICLTLVGFYPFRVAADMPILSGSVMVTAVQQGDPNDLLFELTISHGIERHRLSTLPSIAGSDQAKALSALKKTIGWKGGYLFVREECGGGNTRRCNLDHVFALREGRLAYIGEAFGGEARTGPWPFYRDGYFMDVYNKFEDNDLTGHAGAPAIRLLMQEKGGRFHVDFHRTWQANRQQFAAILAAIQKMLAKTPQESLGLSEVAVPLLFNAVLTKYCNRQTEYKQTVRLAKTAVGAGVQRILYIVTDVVPGELPQRVGSVRQLHADMRTR